MTALPAANSYDQIKSTFEAMFEADLPSRITLEFVEKKLGQKNGDAATIMSLMEQFGMIAADGTPTILYHAFRNEETRASAFAEAIKYVYRDLYRISEAVHYSEMYQPNETPHTSDRDSLEEHFARLMDIQKGSDEAEAYVGTFQSLCSLADFKR